MRVLFVGDAISGRLILEEIKKVGVLVALAIADRDRTKLTNFGTPIIDINTINQMSSYLLLQKLEVLQQITIILQSS